MVQNKRVDVRSSFLNENATPGKFGSFILLPPGLDSASKTEVFNVKRHS